MFNGETVWMPKLITQFAYTDLLETCTVGSAYLFIPPKVTCSVYTRGQSTSRVRLNDIWLDIARQFPSKWQCSKQFANKIHQNDYLKRRSCSKDGLLSWLLSLLLTVVCVSYEPLHRHFGSNPFPGGPRGPASPFSPGSPGDPVDKRISL